MQSGLLEKSLMDNRPRDLFWAELVELKVACEYFRRYSDNLTFWVTRFAVIRAVVSVSALGTWAAVKSYPIIWGGIIAAAQVADAVQNAIPFAARLRSTTALATTMEALFIDARMDLERVRAGLTDAETLKLLHNMMKLRLEAEVKHHAGSIPAKPKLMRLAKDDADAYFRTRGQTGANT